MHPAAALRRTLTVTIIPVTFASGAAAPGKVVQVSGARGRRYRENAGGWSRGAGLRTVFESLYGVPPPRRLCVQRGKWFRTEQDGAIHLKS